MAVEAAPAGTASREDPRLSEDVVCIEPGCVAVLDGASVPEGIGTGCCHGTAWYTRQLAAHAAALAQNPRFGLDEALGRAIGAVRAAHDSTCDLDNPMSPSATVALARWNSECLQWLVLADALVLVERTDDTIEVVQDLRDDALTPELSARARRHTPGDARDEARWRDHTVAQRAARNRPGGSWIARSEPEAAGHALTGSVDLRRVRSFAVMSDGAARLVTPFALTDWNGLAHTLREEGPAGLLEQVRTAEGTDGDAARWPRVKRHDDAAVVHCAPVRPRERARRRDH
ncbi:hypothetical protein [Streptomyces sp. NPDC088785]|uniref:hypothetical protein n=1 Tax=Streptomyces sp. NPDC088785 TaxID=3365897 RepID=UPI0037FE8C87